MRKLKISASILSADFSNLGSLVRQLESAGVDSIHLDVMDGHFVKNISFGALVVSTVRKNTDLPLEVHMMVERPDIYIKQFAEAGSDMLIIHLESKCDTLSTIKTIKEHGMNVGVALNPETAFEDAIRLLPVDMLLLMAVNPGVGGQKFMPESLAKIGAARSFIEKNSLDMDIGVDGGINIQTAIDSRDAGANQLVAGTFITNSLHMNIAVNDLKKLGY